MKIKLNKNIRIIGIGMLVIGIGALSFLLYKGVYSPGFKEEKVALYSYQQKTNIDYKAILKPNVLYSHESLGPGEVYITELIDYIQASFTYEFIGERAAALEGNYEIIAKLEGTVKEGEKALTIWKKSFILQPKQSFQVKDKMVLLKGNANIRPEEYNNFVKTVNESTKVNTPVSCIISMNVNLKANTDKGVVEEKMAPTMVIPLNTSYFSIDSKLTEEKSGQIEETRQVPVSVNQKKVIVYGVILGLLVILGIIMIFFSETKAPLDPRQKKLQQIFKKNGDRLVALTRDIPVPWGNHKEVKSIDDLVRVADEIGKPIFYKYSPDYKEILRFYVIDDDQMYLWHVNEELSKTDKALNAPSTASEV